MAKRSKYADLYTLRSDGRYMGYYRDRKGVRHAVYARDPDELHQKILDKEAEAALPEPEATFRKVAESWERIHREEIEDRTWKNYKPHYEELLDRYGDLPFSQVEAADIVQDLARAKARGLSATVVNARRSIWRMIYDHAIITGVTKYNPVSSVKLPKGLHRGKRTAPSEEEMKTILGSLDAPFGLFAFLLLCTGLRKSEALALNWTDVDLKEDVIHVTKSLDYTNGSNPKYKMPKTAAGTRDVPIIGILHDALEAARKGTSSVLVFPAPPSNRGGAGGGLMSDRAYDGAWERYCAAVGFVDKEGNPTITAHQLRHGTATILFESEVDELSAQRILGHSRVEITREIYTDLRAKQLGKSISRFDEAMRAKKRTGNA